MGSLASVKLNIPYILLYMFLLISIGVCGCEREESVNPPGSLVPSVMMEDALYYTTGLEVEIEIDKSEYIGEITSVVSLAQWPEENGQANIPYEGAPYARYEEGIVLLIQGDWILFEKRHVPNDKNLSVQEYSAGDLSLGEQDTELYMELYQEVINAYMN